MAIPRRLSPEQSKQPPTASVEKGPEQSLRRAEQQKALAQEMIKTAQEMCERAMKMRKAPHLALP